MARNIIFIILFIVLYGGLFLLGSKTSETTVDRNGFGEFSENHYSCDACSFEMELKPEWIPLDGVAIEKAYTESELYDYFGEPGSYDIIAGFTTPEIYMECIRYKNFDMGDEFYTSSAIAYELEICKENISLSGGTLGSSGSSIQQAAGNGENMAVYYYDYTVGDEYYSEFNCFVTCGNDTLWFYGNYNNREGLNELKEFVSSGLTFYSSAEITV